MKKSKDSKSQKASIEVPLPAFTASLQTDADHRDYRRTGMSMLLAWSLVWWACKSLPCTWVSLWMAFLAFLFYFVGMKAQAQFRGGGKRTTQQRAKYTQMFDLLDAVLIIGLAANVVGFLLLTAGRAAVGPGPWMP